MANTRSGCQLLPEGLTSLGVSAKGCVYRCIYVYPIPDPNPGAQPKNPASHSRFNLIKNVQQDTMLRIQMKCQGKVGWVGFLGNGKGERKGDFPGGGWAVGRWAWHGVGSKHQTGCAKWMSCRVNLLSCFRFQWKVGCRVTRLCCFCYAFPLLLLLLFL